MTWQPHIFDQLRVQLPYASSTCGAAAVATLLAANTDGRIDAHGIPSRTDLFARIWKATGAPTDGSRGTYLTELKSAYESFSVVGMSLPTMAAISGGVTVWPRVTRALQRGASVLVGVEYEVITEYGHGLSGQPGYPLDPGHKGFVGKHWVAIRGLIQEDDHRETQWFDSLRNGRRQLPRGVTSVPLGLVRKAALATGRIEVGIAFPLKSLDPIADYGMLVAALPVGDMHEYGAAVLAVPRP